jgi:hypothetical protein
LMLSRKGGRLWRSAGSVDAAESIAAGGIPARLRAAQESTLKARWSSTVWARAVRETRGARIGRG